MYPVFLDAGYEPSLFWSLGIDEIIDLIESYKCRMELQQQRRKADLKDQIMVLWNQNVQLMNLYSSANNSEIQIKKPHEYYPELFTDEIEQLREETQTNDMTLHKARMEEYAYWHNRAIKERGEGDGRNDT